MNWLLNKRLGESFLPFSAFSCEKPSGKTISPRTQMIYLAEAQDHSYFLKHRQNNYPYFKPVEHFFASRTSRTADLLELAFHKGP